MNPLQEHDFCSPEDFVKEPALSWMKKLSTEVKMAIRRSKILFCDSYAFMVLPPDTIVSALDYAMVDQFFLILDLEESSLLMEHLQSKKHSTSS